MDDEIFFEMAIGTRFRRVLEMMTSAGDRLYEEAGLNFKVSYFYPVYALSLRGPMPIADIAKLAGFSHSAVSQTIKKLVGEGLVETKRASDGRQKTVSLTEAGTDMVKRVQPLWRAFECTVKDIAADTGVDILAGVNALEEAFAVTSFYDRTKARLANTQGVTSPYSIETFDIRYRQAFYDYNIAWLEGLFVVEAIDKKILSDPETSILAKGGEIFFAVENGKAIGTVAMKTAGDGVFELTKLAVDPKVRRGGIGRALCEKVIERFQARGGKTLYLETNTKLKNAIRLYWKLDFVELPSPFDSPYERADYYMEWQPKTAAKIRAVR